MTRFIFHIKRLQQSERTQNPKFRRWTADRLRQWSPGEQKQMRWGNGCPICLERDPDCIPKKTECRKKSVVSLCWESLQSDSSSWRIQGRAREEKADQKESCTETSPCRGTPCVNEETLGDKAIPRRRWNHAYAYTQPERFYSSLP